MKNGQEISKQLLDVLSQIKDTVQKILEIEDQKYDVIKNMEIDQLLVVNEEEVDLLHKIEILEAKRVDLIETLSLKIGFDPQQPISKIAKFLAEEDQENILSISMEIKKLCTRIDIITDRNEYILKNSVEIIAQILELTQGTPVEQYNSQGLSADVKKHSLHMLDQLV